MSDCSLYSGHDDFLRSAQALTPAQWHAMTQAQRNQQILNRAYQDNGRYVGLNCKQWVQAVVPSASAYAVTVPPTNSSPNDWYWQHGPYVVQVPQPASILWAQPGWIVQMRMVAVSGGFIPHTAIVVSVYGNIITFIDSNYYSSTYPLTVRVHSMTDTEFYSKVSGYQFTMYYFQ